MTRASYHKSIPPRCWVGDQYKNCYETREEAEAAALVAQYDHGIPALGVYKCEYGDHWHLSSSRRRNRTNDH